MPVIEGPEVYEVEDTTGVLDRLWADVPALDAAPASGTATYRVQRGVEDVSWAHGSRRRTSFAARFLVTERGGTLVLILARTAFGRVRGGRAAAALRREVAAVLAPVSGR